ncbi:MAG: 2-isopropylmalate synthase [Promethearchaeota archaeon]
MSPFMERVREGALFPERVYFFDTTLRDGEQTPGISFTHPEKVMIARQLDRLGIDIIEAGFPRVSSGDYQACKEISKIGLSAEVIGLARMNREDIDAVVECDMDSIHVFIATSELHMAEKLRMTRQEVLDAITTWVEYAKQHFSTVEFSAEDATRSDLDFLLKANQTAVEAGAKRVNIPDTVGTITPRAFGYLVRKHREALPSDVRISVHCHDDFGLSTANSLAGLENGAAQVHTTILGLGERAGNASLEEVAMSVYALYGLPMNIDTRQIYPTAKLIERLSGERIPSQFPLVGRNAFRHESGIHAHAVIANPRNYEPLTPELIGINRSDQLEDVIQQSITLGKHTGGHALRAKLEELGVEMTNEQFSRVMEHVKQLGDKGHKVIEQDLLAIIKDVLGDVPESQKIVILDELTVLTGSVTPTSTVRLRVRQGDHYETRVGSSVGVGPVDASMQAILSTFKEIGDVTLTEYNIDAVTGGTDALGRVSIKLRDDTGRIYEVQAVHEDIVMSSVKALIIGLNKVMWAKRK